MTTGRGTRAMQLLAVRLIELRDPRDAMVLGDAMMERGIDTLLTGRSRPVLFRTSDVTRLSDNLSRITSPRELQTIVRTHAEHPSFFQQGFETIYNVAQFAADPTEEKWGRIWTQWITPKRGTYRALIDSDLLPRSIRMHEIAWAPIYERPYRGASDDLLSYALYLVRVPKKRKRELRTHLFDIHRRESDNPRTSDVDSLAVERFKGDLRRA